MTTSTGEITADLREQPGRGAVPADTFAIRLMLVRVHAGNLTIQDAAERIGVTNQSWSNWERGMQPRDKADLVRAISDEYGIDRDWLMYGGRLAPEPRRDRRGAVNGRLAERRKGLTFRDDSRDGDVTCRSVRRPGGRSDARRPGDNRPAGRPDEFTRPSRLTSPIIR